LVHILDQCDEHYNHTVDIQSYASVSFFFYYVVIVIVVVVVIVQIVAIGVVVSHDARWISTYATTTMDVQWC
jgi:hypothetical protein